jgi:hypothetical protein
MFKLMKWLMFAAFVVAFIWFGSNVKLGKFTLFGHVQRIWKSDETQDLVKGTKEAAGPTIEKVKRGVEVGVDEARKLKTDDKVDNDAAPAMDKAPPATDDQAPVHPRKRSGRRAQR